MASDVNIRIALQGLQKVTADLNKVSAQFGATGAAGAKGGKTATKGLKDIESQSKKTTSSLSSLKQIFGGLIGIATVKTIVSYADAMSLANSRIKLVTKSSDELVTVQRELMTAAQETRTSYESTVELYARVARSAGTLGLSQKDLLDLTTTVNKAIQVSGATAAEASAGVIQFAQGLASGALRGDELRSVMEQMPRLAQALTDGMGVSLGELKKLGEAGALTTEMVVAALKKSAPDIASEFSQMDATISSAFTVIKNGFMSMIGQVDKVTGVSGNLANMLVDVGKDMGNVSKEFLLGAVAVKEFVTVATISLTSLDDHTKLAGNSIKGTLATLFDKTLVGRTINEQLGWDTETMAQERVQLVSNLSNQKADIEQYLESIRSEFALTRDNILNPADVDLTEHGSALGKAFSLTAKEAKKLQDAIEKANKGYALFVGNIEAENNLIQATIDGKELLIDQYTLEIEARNTVKSLSSAMGRVLLPEEAEAVGELVRQHVDLEKALEKKKDADKAAEKAVKDHTREMERQAKKAEELMQEPFKNALSGIQGAFTGFFEQVLSGGINSFKSLGQAIKGVFIKLIAELATLKLGQALFGGLGGGIGGSTGGGIGGFLSSAFGGGGGLGGAAASVFGGGLSRAGIGAASTLIPAAASAGIAGSIASPQFLASAAAGGVQGIAANTGSFIGAGGSSFSGLSSLGSVASGLAGNFSSILAGAGSPSLSILGANIGDFLGFGAGGSVALGNALGFSPYGALGGLAANLFGLGGGGLIGTGLSTAGSLIGGAFGGPIGAGIGGFLGSALGGLFGGGKPSSAGGGAVVDYASGAGSTTGSDPSDALAFGKAIAQGLQDLASALGGSAVPGYNVNLSNTKNYGQIGGASLWAITSNAIDLPQNLAGAGGSYQIRSNDTQSAYQQVLYQALIGGKAISGINPDALSLIQGLPSSGLDDLLQQLATYGFESGGSMMVTKPTLINVGEGGKAERVDITPLSGSGNRSSSQVVINGPLIMNEIGMIRFMRELETRTNTSASRI